MSHEFPEIGEIFEEKYRLKSVIGEGGFARIYRAVQTDLEREVALKILNPEAEDHRQYETNVERFKREAQLLAKLRDPHTITLHEHGKAEGELWYLVFEYVDGRSLKEIVGEHGSIAPTRVVTIVRQIAMSLQEAHAEGVLHRDIKPANIMVYDHMGRTDRVKLLDFGIAKAILADDDELQNDVTQTGALLGTPRYMSPEQLEETADIGPGADLYSLGLVTYELLTGEKAIPGSGFAEIVKKHLVSGSIQLPDAPELSAELRTVVNRMLAKPIEARFGDAEELLEALEALDEARICETPVDFTESADANDDRGEIEETRTDLPGRSPAGGPGGDDGGAARRTVADDATTAPGRRTEDWEHGSRPYWIGAAIAVLVLAAGALGYLETSTPGDAESRRASSKGASETKTPTNVRSAPENPSDPPETPRAEAPSDRQDDPSGATPETTDPPETKPAAGSEAEPAPAKNAGEASEPDPPRPSGEAAPKSGAEVDETGESRERAPRAADEERTAEPEPEPAPEPEEPSDESDTSSAPEPKAQKTGAKEETDDDSKGSSSDSTFIDLTELEGE